MPGPVWQCLLLILLHRPATEEDEGGAEKEEEEGRIPSSLLRSQSSENLAVEPLTLQAARWDVEVWGCEGCAAAVLINTLFPG